GEIVARLKTFNFGRLELAERITADDTTLTLVDASACDDDDPFRIVIDKEIIELDSIDKSTHVLAHLTRAVEGTTPAPHTAGTPVYHIVTAGTIQDLAWIKHDHSTPEESQLGLDAFDPDILSEPGKTKANALLVADETGLVG